ncbi:uncharacterized protein SOCG_00303 [Schizosaccharomyces octosporus yFS286]|uniref:Cytochrome c oxidase assembly factor 6 n=1 Tax=Schizosaccharomyces octosporus (strain yFS286) TaxID=483514 RepID=S9R2D0_SCHOY|nr:uncharacterized protein SOCG_00303 [Schizosaccharomyces octosporus yFS286]EPX72540.1 hypothetical protein SOCG_00303 [Schizosaccharomyces octosporus yFS286]
MSGNTSSFKRSAREKCWEARDFYFDCLNKNDILDPLKDNDRASQVCSSEKTNFESNCIQSWVNYFCKFRVQQHKQQEAIRKLEESGARRL